MNMYVSVYILFALLTLYCYKKQQLRYKKADNIIDKLINKESISYNQIIYSFIILLIWGGLRGAVGTDDTQYQVEFSYMYMYPFSVLYKLSEPGFVLLNKLVHYISSEYFVMRIVETIIISTCYLWVVKKNSDFFALSILIFVCDGIFLRSFNVTRQILAASIFALNIVNIQEKKFLRYVIVTLIAASIHKSALFLIPFYFLFNIKMNKKKIILLLIIYSCMAALCYIFSDSIVGLAQKTLYSHYTEDSFDMDKGLKYKHILKPLLVLIYIFVNINNIDVNNSTNMACIHAALLYFLFQVLTIKIAMSQRFLDYFTWGEVLIVPHIFIKLNKKDKYIQLLIIMGIILSYAIALNINSEYHFFWEE